MRLLENMHNSHSYELPTADNVSRKVMQPYKSTYTTGSKKPKTKQMKKKGKNNASRNIAKK